MSPSQKQPLIHGSDSGCHGRCPKRWYVSHSIVSVDFAADVLLLLLRPTPMAICQIMQQYPKR